MGTKASIFLVCSFCARINGQLSDNSNIIAVTSMISPSSPVSSPTSTALHSQASVMALHSQASVTHHPLPTSTPTMPASPAPAPLLIILGATTGFFLVTTLLCTIVVAVLCCQKARAGMKTQEPREGQFEDSRVTPHWINTPTPQEADSKAIIDLPIWSVETFSSGSNLNETNSSLNNTNTADTSTTPSADPKTRVPKRVAPPPPKNKKGNAEPAVAHEVVVYDVPVTSHGWFGRKKKPSKYKELNINQLQVPSTYTTPQIDS